MTHQKWTGVFVAMAVFALAGRVNAESTIAKTKQSPRPAVVAALTTVFNNHYVGADSLMCDLDAADLRSLRDDAAKNVRLDCSYYADACGYNVRQGEDGPVADVWLCVTHSHDGAAHTYNDEDTGLDIIQLPSMGSGVLVYNGDYLLDGGATMASQLNREKVTNAEIAEAAQDFLKIWDEKSIQCGINPKSCP